MTPFASIQQPIKSFQPHHSEVPISPWRNAWRFRPSRARYDDGDLPSGSLGSLVARKNHLDRCPISV